MGLSPRDDVPMKLPHRRRPHEGAGSTWRPISAWWWMLAAAAAVVIVAFVVTVWLLAIASGANPGTDRANSRLDAVRTGLAAGAGAGAAVGLMLAFRRQHHQEIATDLTDRDATERRITELYTKAVEQLGNDKAPVRLGGLYALERLAQDNPAHRQTIVNVICAYLRMPFRPRRASKPESPRPPKPRERQVLRLKRALMRPATCGSKKGRCVLPRSASLPSICVMTGSKVSAPLASRARVSGPASASISLAPPLSTSTSTAWWRRTPGSPGRPSPVPRSSTRRPSAVPRSAARPSPRRHRSAGRSFRSRRFQQGGLHRQSLVQPGVLRLRRRLQRCELRWRHHVLRDEFRRYRRVPAGDLHRDAMFAGRPSVAAPGSPGPPLPAVPVRPSDLYRRCHLPRGDLRRCHRLRCATFADGRTGCRSRDTGTVTWWSRCLAGRLGLGPEAKAGYLIVRVKHGALFPLTELQAVPLSRKSEPQPKPDFGALESLLRSSIWIAYGEATADARTRRTRTLPMEYRRTICL